MCYKETFKLKIISINWKKNQHCMCVCKNNTVWLHNIVKVMNISFLIFAQLSWLTKLVAMMKQMVQCTLYIVQHQQASRVYKCQLLFCRFVYSTNTREHARMMTTIKSESVKAYMLWGLWHREKRDNFERLRNWNGLQNNKRKENYIFN